MAAKTWKGEWWKHGGGGNTWNGFTYDAEFNQILIGTGNGSPWNQKVRSPGGGDNLFLCSIVALDADTGKYKWHYQTVPGETWDYNSSMDIVLADLQIDGKTVKALMHAPKNGFFYVIDRSNGKLMSVGKIAKTTWASAIDLKTGRPIEIKGARYENGDAIDLAEPVRRAQLACDVLQPEDRARVRSQDRALVAIQRREERVRRLAVAEVQLRRRCRHRFRRATSRKTRA